jgi:hypothetical protein
MQPMADQLQAAMAALCRIWQHQQQRATGCPNLLLQWTAAMEPL